MFCRGALAPFSLDILSALWHKEIELKKQQAKEPALNPIFSKMTSANTMCVFHAPDLDGWSSCVVAMQAGIAKED